MKIQLQSKQTIWDIAIQYCGSEEAAFQIADLNDVSVTEELPVGTMLDVPEAVNKQIVEYFKANKIVPATATEEEDGEKIITSSNENMITIIDELIIITNNG